MHKEEIIKTRAEIKRSKTERRKTMEKISKTKRWFFKG